MQEATKQARNDLSLLLIFLVVQALGALVFSSIPIHELHGIEFVLFGLLFISFIAWMLMTLYVYRDAQRRGGNAMLWALFVFFGQVLGFLVYLIMRNAFPKLVGNGEKKCPQCQKPRQDDFTICPYCRAPLQTLCPNCKRVLQTDWQACPYCRHEASSPAMAVQSFEEKLL